MFKAHGLLYHSTLGLRVIKKKKVWVLGVGFMAAVRVWSYGWSCHWRNPRSEPSLAALCVWFEGIRSLKGSVLSAGRISSVNALDARNLCTDARPVTCARFNTRVARNRYWTMSNTDCGRQGGSDLRGTSLRFQGSSHTAASFRGGLVFKAHTLLYHSTLGLRVIKKKKKKKKAASGCCGPQGRAGLYLLIADVTV